MEELVKNIELLLKYSDLKLYVLIGMDISKNIPFDINQVMQSQEIEDYEKGGYLQNQHRKDFIQIMNDKIKSIDRWYHIGKSWFIKHKNKFRKSVCTNKTLKFIRQSDEIEFIIDIINLILPEKNINSLASIASSILIARKGLNIFCKDFDEN